MGGSGEKKASAAPKFTTQTVVLADGTYGTKNVYEAGEEEVAEKDLRKVPLRALIQSGDQLLATSLGTCLSRLCLRASGITQSVRNDALFVVANLYKLSASSADGEQKQGGGSIRLAQCIRALVAANGGGNVLQGGGQQAAADITQADWASNGGRDQLCKVLEMQAGSADWVLGGGAGAEPETKSVAPDDGIVFRQLMDRKGASGIADVIDDDDFSAARGSTLGQAAADGQLFSERLARVKQMTGLADPVYVEAFLQVHNFDLVLELLVVNRTSEVLQNVLVELSTQGDLKIVDRPVAVTLAPGQQATVHASVKVASTETGVLFGYVTHDKKGATDKECTVMNELRVDILDYIECAAVGEVAFHSMWSEFEWENKININTSITEVGTFLGHIMRNTNMSIVGRGASRSNGARGDKKKKKKLTETDVEEMLRDAHGVRELIESSSFVAVNLYAKSIFGEDALANVSIEKVGNNKLTGSVRIRSRQQGIALSLGERVTVVQRGVGANAIAK